MTPELDYKLVPYDVINIIGDLEAKFAHNVSYCITEPLKMAEPCRKPNGKHESKKILSICKPKIL